MDIRGDGWRVCKFGFFLFQALMMKDENDHARGKRGSSAIGYTLEAVNGGGLVNGYQISTNFRGVPTATVICDLLQVSLYMRPTELASVQWYPVITRALVTDDNDGVFIVYRVRGFINMNHGRFLDTVPNSQVQRGNH